MSDYNHDGTLTRSAFNIAAEVGVIPEKATVGMAVRRGKSGQADMNGSNKTDNAILLTANYKLAQNMMLTLNYTKQSGSLWDAAHTASEGSRTSTLNLFTEF